MSGAASEKTVLYGVCGEGFGHLSRAEFLVPRLLDAGYRVVLHSSGRVGRMLPELFPDCECRAIDGLRFRYRDNRLDVLASGLQHARIVLWWPGASLRYTRMMRRERPLAAISDYEPVIARCANYARVPSVAFDHQQVTTICDLRDDLAAHGFGLRAMRFFNAMVNGHPDLRVATSFFHPTARREGRRREPRLLVGPILREEALRRAPTEGDHIAVYQTSDSAGWLDAILARLPGKKRVYGASVAPSADVEPRPRSRDAFLDDLASCRFALVNGGHTGISEALHFGKPILCLPVRRQVEQEMNAAWVERLGFGRAFSSEPGSPLPDFAPFLDRLDEFRRNIAAKAIPCGNEEAARAILGFLAEQAAKRRGAPPVTGT